jgi:mRNA interferase YafQ
MLSLFRAKTFLKDYSKVKFTDKLYVKYVVYVSTLLKEESLPPEAYDHSLTGNYNTYREFHISGDLLVIYKIENMTLQLIRIGTHSQLFT